MQPFSFSSFGWSFVAAATLLIVLPRDERALRWGAILYGAALLAAVAVDTPLGGNLVRMAALFGGPLAAGALWDRRMLTLAVIALPLLYWQWLAPVRSVIRGAGDRSSQLRLPRAADQGARPPAGDRGARAHRDPVHGEPLGDALRPAAPRARPRLGAPARREAQPAVLRPHRVLAGALPPLAGRHGRRLRRPPGRRARPGRSPRGAPGPRGTVPGLREVWHSRHWRLYRVEGSRPLASPPVRVRSIGSASVTLTTPRPATTTVRVRFTPYWALKQGSGCVGPAPAAGRACSSTAPASRSWESASPCAGSAPRALAARAEIRHRSEVVVVAPVYADSAPE